MSQGGEGMELIRLRGKRGMLIERMCTLTNIDTNSYLSLPKYHEVCMVSGMQRGGGVGIIPAAS